ncbi:MAG TPA: glycosyltransferase, partial [Acidimicrobiales bacterium]
MSTHAFGRALTASGHDVVGLVRSFDHPHRDLLHEELVDASVKAPRLLGRAIEAVDTALGRRAHVLGDQGYPVWSTPYPEHAVPRLLRLFEPDVVVGNSIDRVSWRRASALARRAGARTALHLREANAVGHLTISNEVPDVLLANAQSLVDLAAESGYSAFLVPSVVEVERFSVSSSRRVAMLVNPEPDFGLDLVLRLAAARPDVPFVLQESRLLGRELEKLERRVESLPNVEVRRRRRPAEVYADVRVLLVPHQNDAHSNRPRVVLEAQHNGIPVVASDLAGLREAVGKGGLFVPPEASDELW